MRRDFIRTHAAEGRSRAQKRGQHMGRPPKLTDANVDVPDPTQPYVAFPGTPYAHLMLPLTAAE